MKDYNTSILTNNKSIYYYKRLFGDCKKKESIEETECSELRLFRYDFANTRGNETGVETMMSDSYNIKDNHQTDDPSLMDK